MEPVRSYTTSSAEETIELGRQLARGLPKRAVVLLSGNLGAGKTTLAKGIVSELTGSPPDDIVSPTFTLIHEYEPGPAGTRVYHIDLYRLERTEQISTLGLDEIFDQNAVVLIEWGERFLEAMPQPRIEICLKTPASNPDQRHVTIAP